ncbi:nitrate- and nitrite sensing domain-containing protein [Streptomyces sp. SL13]|uniref:histidine kinase n=1 Tax=Streptantibioticus silvisoli TaxID=2705255 RepID=A0AA90K191_9ACTN|nr:sensor histidine kinase [Streptantibioticus silvisoli]MDI5973676.1 nitrate- and nitrite sensing domain-containing protein [Streptantibioticus silvisoli]
MRTTRKGRDATRTAPPTTPADRPGRRLRTRLLAAVLVTLVAVLAAGAPSVAVAAGDLTASQHLLRLTQLNTSAIALSHALADERDTVTAFAAAGRPHGGGLTPDQEAGVDRQIADVGQSAASLDTQGSADLADVTRDLRTALAGVPNIRQAALAGTANADQVFDSYTPVVDALDAVSGALARALPDRAADPDTSAGPALARAVTQTSAQHGLLIAALDSGGSTSSLVGAARIARLREQAAEDDFTAAASVTARTQYDQTVTGSDVQAADGYLRRLTATADLTPADRQLNVSTVDQAVSARIDRMRAVQASLAADDSSRLTALRDHDVTALELRAALVGLCALLTLGIGAQTARSVTRPLARVRRYAAEPTGPAPVASGDEFAVVARAIERLSAELDTLRQRVAERDEERARIAAVRQAAAAERDELRRREAVLLEERTAVAAQKDTLARDMRALARQMDALVQDREALLARLGSLQGTVHSTFVNLSLRTLALVDRQLALIEGLENREQDPHELETLFRLDHLATRMRRNSESLLVLAGADTGGGAVSRPVPLVDVVRAGVSEIERYERVRIPFLPRAQLVGFVADDAGHLVAELLENATAFSPPDAEVRVAGWLLETGEVMLSVEDHGIGIPAARLDELNRMLADPHPDESTSTAGLGLYVVARLAGRHGIRVELRPQSQGGTCAIVVLPAALVTGPPDSDWTQLTPPADPFAAHDTTPDATTPDPGTPAYGTAPADGTPAYGATPNHGAEPAQGTPAHGTPAHGTPAHAAPEHTAGPTTPTPTTPAQAGPAHATPAQAAPVHNVPAQTGPAHAAPAHTTPVPGAEHARSAAGPGAGGLPTRPRAGGAPGPDEPAAPDSTRSGAPAAGGTAPDGLAGAGGGRPAPAGAALPKRIPRASGLSGEPAVRGRDTPVDADALRRKLGGFAAGLRHGRRDAEAEAEATGAVPLPAPRTPGDRSDSEPSEEARG